MGEWEWGVVDGGLSTIPTPESPIPNPQSPIELLNKFDL